MIARNSRFLPGLFGLAVTTAAAACVPNSRPPNALTAANVSSDWTKTEEKWGVAGDASGGARRPGPAVAGTPGATGAPSAWPSVSDELQLEKAASRDAAIVVAIENYAFLSKIPGATRNGQDWYRYFTKTLKIPLDRVTLIANSDGTAENILDAARATARKAKPGGRVWFIFVGHGAPQESGDDGLLVAVDAQQSAKGIARRSVPQGDLLTALARGPATPVAVIDACFSGQGANGQQLVTGLMPSKVVEPKVPRTAVVMSAARNDQFAGPLPGDERPAFSYLVLGGLRGWADDDQNGVVTAEEAVNYASGALRATLAGKRGQIPQLNASQRDLTLAPAAERGPNLSDIVLWLSGR